jgi:hypothetical protein
MTRRAFNPTAEQRGNVEAMIGYGIPEADICLLIKNPETGKPIDLKTLRSQSSRSVKPTPNSNCICLRVAPCCDSALASRML